MRRTHNVLVFGVVLALVFGLVRASPVQALSCISPPSNIVSWWPGDGNPNDIRDGNHGSLVNGATFAGGRVAQAFSFDGIDDFVNIPDSFTLDAITSTITVDFWVKPSQPDKNVWIFARRDPLASEGFSVLIGPSGEIMINIRTTTSPTPSGTVFWAAPILQFGVWQHVAVTADTSTGQVYLYVDGNNLSLVTIFGPSPITGQFFNVDNLFIGRRQSSLTVEGPVGGGHYVGQVDEVEIFNRALTVSEVQAIFDSGSAGKCKLQVSVDVKPGGVPNSINPGSQGLIPVAVLSTATFNAPSQVNGGSVTFGRTGNEESLAFCNASPEDVNFDGLLDLVCHFFTNQTEFQAGDTQGTLKGLTVDGISFIGVDSVRIVPP